MNSLVDTSSSVARRTDVRLPRRWNRSLIGSAALATLLVVSGIAGLRFDFITQATPSARAFTCADEITCTQSTVASSLHVTHKTEDGDKVNLTTRTDWEVTAKWAGPGVSALCEYVTERMKVRVTVSGNMSSVTCLNNCSSPTLALGTTGICSTDKDCIGNLVWGYEIFFDVAKQQSITTGTAWLYQVEYQTSLVDPGLTMCALTPTVYPVTQVFQTADNGAFECENSSCDTPGANIELTFN